MCMLVRNYDPFPLLKSKKKPLLGPMAFCPICIFGGYEGHDCATSLSLKSSKQSSII